MIGVARQAIAHDFGIDFCAACLGMFIFFEHHDARAFAHDKTVAVLVIRAARCFGAVIIGHVERACLCKTGDTKRIDCAFRAAREHHIGIIVADHPCCVANRMRASGAGGHDRVIGTFQAIFDADLSRNQVNQAAVDEVWRNAARAFLGQHQRFAFNTRKPANARTNRTARADFFFLAHVGEAGIFQCLSGGIDAVDDERIDLPLNLVVNAQIRIKAPWMILGLHFARDMAFLVAGVEAGDTRCAGFRGKQICPSGFNICPQRRNQTQTGDDDTTHCLTSKSCISLRPITANNRQKANGFPTGAHARWPESRLNFCASAHICARWFSCCC